MSFNLRINKFSYVSVLVLLFVYPKIVLVFGQNNLDLIKSWAAEIVKLVDLLMVDYIAPVIAKGLDRGVPNSTPIKFHVIGVIVGRYSTLGTRCNDT